MGYKKLLIKFVIHYKQHQLRLPPAGDFLIDKKTCLKLANQTLKTNEL